MYLYICIGIPIYKRGIQSPASSQTCTKLPLAVRTTTSDLLTVTSEGARPTNQATSELKAASCP